MHSIGLSINAPSGTLICDLMTLKPKPI